MSTSGVWITRSQPGAQELAAELVKLHLAPIIEPVIEIVPATGWQTSPGLSQATPRAVVVTSRAAAAEYVLSALWLRVQNQAVTHVAVGAATAAVLQAEAAINAAFPTREDSSGVLDLLRHLPPGAPVWIIAGVGGRTYIADALTQAGCQPIVYHLYQRNPVAVLRTTADQVSALEVSSVAAANRVARHFQNGLQNSWQNSACAELPCVVPSSRVGDRLLELGFRNVHNAQAAARVAMAAKLAQVTAA